MSGTTATGQRRASTPDRRSATLEGYARAPRCERVAARGWGPAPGASGGGAPRASKEVDGGLMRVRTAALIAVLAAASPLVRAQRPPAPAGEWRYYGGDAASTRYSPLADVTRANVNNLQVVWRWNSPDNEIVKANPTSRPAQY